MSEGDIQKEPAPEPRQEPPRRPPLDDDDLDVRRQPPSVAETFIPYKNPLGLFAYYAGVFSFIPCAGLALGPTALILGILGVRYRNKHPTAGGLGHAISGIVMGSLTSLGNWGVVIAFLVAMGMAGWK
jgi:hypothetical protein